MSDKLNKEAFGNNPRSAEILEGLKLLATSNTAKSLYAGAGLASLFSLLRESAIDKKISDIYSDDKTDKETLLLRLPKGAVKKSSTAVPKRDGSGTSHKRVPVKSVRDPFPTGPKAKPDSVKVDVPLDGTSEKEPESKPVENVQVSGAELDVANITKKSMDKEAVPDFLKQWYGEGAAPLGVAAAGVGSYMLVNKIYRKLLEKRLAEDEEAARREYLDALIPKEAMELEKEALSMGGTAALLTLLLAGGSAKITKDIMDARADSRRSNSYAPPTVRRIVFKATDEDEGEEVSQDQLKAAFYIKAAEVSGINEDFVTDDIIEACVKLGMIKSAQVGQGQKTTIWSMLKGFLSKLSSLNPELAKRIMVNGAKRFGSKFSPALAKFDSITDKTTGALRNAGKGVGKWWGWGGGVIGSAANAAEAKAQSMRDRKIEAYFEDPANRQRVLDYGVDKLRGGVGNFLTRTGQFLSPYEKTAFSPILSSVIGSTIADANQKKREAEEAEAAASRGPAKDLMEDGVL